MVRAVQKTSRITVDGQVGPATYYQLGLRKVTPAPVPFPLFPLHSVRYASLF